MYILPMRAVRFVRQLLVTLLFMPLAAFAPVEGVSRPLQRVTAATTGQVLRSKRSGWLRLKVFRRNTNGETRFAGLYSVFVGSPRSRLLREE